MVNDPLKVFRRNLLKFLIEQEEDVNGLLVKKHSVNLQVQGEFSFPNTIKSWHVYVNTHALELNECSLLTFIEKNTGDITQASQKWQISIKDAKLMGDRVHLFLNRDSAIQAGLKSSLLNTGWITQSLTEKKSFTFIDSMCNGTCITSLRVKYLTEAIECLFAINSIHLPQLTRVVVSSNPKSLIDSSKERVILCGPVLNANTNVKEKSLKGEDFIRLRQNELTLIAQHKYGVRVNTDDKWREFTANLGESAVTFELLQTKPSCAVKINFEVSGGSSKGAAFILYNCARLETIIRTYNKKVLAGSYPPLPSFEMTDFKLLTQEDEWCLVFNYILGLPSLLKNCMEVTEHTCEFRPHLVCGFLNSMVKLISQYYRKTRILTEPRRHLLPVMFARLHMLTILNDILKICLRILNIKSVSQM